MTAVKSEVIVKSAIPFGNIPRRAVEVLTTESLTGKCFTKSASRKSAIPKGIMIFPVKPAILSMDFMIRELIGLTVLASSISLEA